MPNGKPGDHPLTDILLHSGSSEFGEPVNGLVKEIATLAAFPSVRTEVAALLEQLSPTGRPVSERGALVKQATARLTDIKRRLEARENQAQTES